MATISYRARFAFDHRFTARHASEYVDDAMAAGRRLRVERHAVDCPECRALLEQLRGMIAALSRLSEPAPPALPAPPAPSAAVSAAQRTADAVLKRLHER